MNNSQLTADKLKLIVARARYVKLSPRKLRLVADSIRKMDPEKAVAYLKVLPQKAARAILAVFMQGIANAKNNFQISPGDLTIAGLLIEEGPRGPKRLDKSHGARFDRGIRRKKLAHITLKLAVKEKKAI
jgi:large subunit ribosomal protein L22